MLPRLEDSQPALRTLSGPSRLKLALVAAALWGPLIVASRLGPDPRSFGTHEQLGLPPCTFATLFHMRCPTCGMTTAWAHAAHGQLQAALATHVTGTALAGASFLAGTWLFAVVALGRPWAPRLMRLTLAAYVAIGFSAALLIEWAVRIAAR